METTVHTFRGFAREQLWKALPSPSLRELLWALGPISASPSRLHSSASLSAINNRARWTGTEGSTGWLHSACSQKVQCSETTLLSHEDLSFTVLNRCTDRNTYLAPAGLFLMSFFYREGLLVIVLFWHACIHTYHMCFYFHTMVLIHSCTAQQSTQD